MKRRKFLLTTAALSTTASAAGCSYLQNPGSEIRITNVQKPTFEYIDLSFDVQEIQKTPTTETPSIVQIQITNNGSMNVLFKNLKRIVFDAFMNTDTDDYAIHLYRPDILQKDSVGSSDCWKLTEPVIQPESNLEMSLWPNESKAIELYVIPGVDSPNCFPKGQYTFNTIYDIYDQTSDQLLRNVEWRFDIEII